MESLNNRITKVDNFLQLLRLIRKGKTTENIIKEFFNCWVELLEYYPTENIEEVLFKRKI